LIAALVFAVPTVSHGAEPMESLIDPDRNVYGVPFGATEKQLIEKLGAPSGTIQLSATRRALIYGKTHSFIFRKGTLRTLIVSESILDYRLGRSMEPHPVVDSLNWTLAPGIKKGMSFAQISKLMKRDDSRGDYNLAYETSNAQVELQFAGMRSSRDDSESFSLHGFVIEYEP
jgi:hypothetical protein